MKSTKRIWRHSYEKAGQLAGISCYFQLDQRAQGYKLKYVPPWIMDHKKQDRCKEVAHFNASFELHLHKRDVGIAPLQGRRPDVGVPLISLHVGQVD